MKRIQKIEIVIFIFNVFIVSVTLVIYKLRILSFKKFQEYEFFYFERC